MKNELVLKRSVEIETWQVLATIAKAGKRSELMPVLKRLEETGGSDVRDIAEHLLFDTSSRRVVAERLLEICRLYLLAEKSDATYKLTGKGRLAAQTNQVFMPEKGIWKITFSNDPLLPYPIVKTDLFQEPSARSEIIGKDARSKLEERKKDIQETPGWTKKCLNIESTPCMGGEAIRIDEIERKGEKKYTRLDLIIEWNITKKIVYLLKENKKISQFPGPEREQEGVWLELLYKKGRLDDWDEKSNELSINFDETCDSDRVSMLADFNFKQPKINTLGFFDDFLAEGISIMASDEENAQEWASWRLNHFISNFASVSAFKRWSKEALSPFGNFNVNLPSRDQLATERWESNRGNKETWFVVAAMDWGL